MAQLAFPLSQSPILTVEQWSKIAGNWMNTGVIMGSLNQLQTFADSTGMQIKVKSGAAFIKGVYFESDSEETLAIFTADSTNPRIDRVIVRFDLLAETMQLSMLQGVAAVSPVAPALTQNSSRWEISLAQVRVNAGAVTITAGNITDERNFVKNGNAVKPERIPFTFQNGWVPQANFSEHGYYLDDFGIVEGWAMITGGTTTSGTTIATLPEGFRPPRNYSFPMVSYDSTNGTRGGRLAVLASGNITVNENTGSGWVVVHFRFPTF
jgi:hypothetical protein